MIVFLFEFTVVVIGATLIATQVFIPVIKNQPIFPILRSRRKLEGVLSETNELVEDNELIKKIESNLDKVEVKKAKKGKV